MATTACGKENVSSSFHYLVDSDVFVALFTPNDALATTVDQLMSSIEKQRKSLCTTNWVIAETATVLSRKDSQVSAIAFLSMIDEGNVPILPVTSELEQEAHRIFRDQTIKNTSMIDCSNVAVANHYGISELLSFDRFYTRFGYQVQKTIKQPI